MGLKAKILTLAFTFFFMTANLPALQIHKERSIYRNIVITENKGKRCMRFETRRRSISNQACLMIKEPEILVFEYTQSLMAGLSFNSTPRNILIIGLGGGSLPTALHKLLPDSEITSVEIDPSVVKLAKKYFNYQENDKLKTEIKDGRVFVKRAIKKNKNFDWIILDAFNGDYIPEHLLTVEFLTEIKTLLSDGGLLSANTFNSSRLYDYESVTYQKVFKAIRVLKSATKGNRIIFACKCENIDQKSKIDQNLRDELVALGVEIDPILARMSNKIDWDTSVRPLTDQYSPANLLNQ